MAKRVLIASALWFLSGWTLGSFLTWSAGAPEILGPLLGLVAAGVVGVASRPATAHRPAAES